MQGWLLSMLRASCCSRFGEWFAGHLSGCETYCPTTAGRILIYGGSSLSWFLPAHLLLAGHMWTAVPKQETKAGSSHLNEDLCLLTSPGLVSPVHFHRHQCWTVCTLPNAQPLGQSHSSRAREEKVFRLIPPLHSPRNSICWVTLQTGPEAWTHHEYQVIFPSCPDCVAVLTGAVNQSNLYDISPWINLASYLDSNLRLFPPVLSMWWWCLGARVTDLARQTITSTGSPHK